MKMQDAGESDDKILAVHADDPQFKHIKDLDEVQKYNPHLLKELEQFFRTYKLLENKAVEVFGWLGRSEAEKVVQESREFYEKNKEKLKN